MRDSRYLKLLSLLVLLVGLGTACCIYVIAEPALVDPFNPLASKRYVHELGLYGGKFNVLAAELTQWFNGLWHGKNLAFTVGVISLFLAWLLWFIGTSWQVEPEIETEGQNR